jgi:glycosyltransferase involved in cell wall biosynthesis
MHRVERKKLIIAYLGGANSIHTVKWVNEMALRGHEVHLISMHPATEELHQNIEVYKLPFKPPHGYYLNTWHLKRLLQQINPDILNTHYASGYGTLARLSGFHPNLLSAWGSDIFDFPYQSKIKMKIIQKNLSAADRIASTSHIMKKQIEVIYKPEKEIAVTPFGVDCEKFKPMEVIRDNNKIRIGTVKTMASQYGIATLIEAFAIVKNEYQGQIELVLVGDGPEEDDLKLLARKLGVNICVDFVGPVPHQKVPQYLNSFDIYVALSNSESFGVAIIEASACGLPVVVSDAGGLPEVVIDGQTGFIVPQNNSEAAAERILRLLCDQELRKEIGNAGRQFVLDNYEWKENADRLERAYEEVIGDFRKCS